MRFIKIPHIDDTWDKVHIKTLSPSSFSWICNGCAYQVLLQKVLYTLGDNTYFLPPHKNTILGTIIHKIYELASKGTLSTPREMMEIWEQLVNEQKKKLIESYPTLLNPKINDYDKRNKAIRYAITIHEKKTDFLLESTNIKVVSEKPIVCEDIGLSGVVDKMIIDSGNIDIIDYKSGRVVDEDGNLKLEYIVQLHLYAAMCVHLSLGNIRSLKLIDIEGQLFDIVYDEELSKALVKDVAERIVKLNNAINARQFEDLIKPDKDRCGYCSCRHICNYMIQSDELIYRTICGYVKRISSSNMYILQNGDITYYISGIGVYPIDDYYGYIGKKLVFINVIRTSSLANNYTYKVTENTLVYEL